MSKTTKIMLGVIIVAILAIGVAYAAITSITLTITGKAESELNQANFKVQFTGAVETGVGDGVKTATVDPVDLTTNPDALKNKATIEVKFDRVTQKAYVYYEIENNSIANITADLLDPVITVKELDGEEISATDSDNYVVETRYVKKTDAGFENLDVIEELAQGEKAYVEVSIYLEHLSLTAEDNDASIKIELEAEPKQ